MSLAVRRRFVNEFVSLVECAAIVPKRFHAPNLKYVFLHTVYFITNIEPAFMEEYYFLTLVKLFF